VSGDMIFVQHAIHNLVIVIISCSRKSISHPLPIPHAVITIISRDTKDKTYNRISNIRKHLATAITHLLNPTTSSLLPGHTHSKYPTPPYYSSPRPIYAALAPQWSSSPGPARRGDARRCEQAKGNMCETRCLERGREMRAFRT